MPAGLTARAKYSSVPLWYRLITTGAADSPAACAAEQWPKPLTNVRDSRLQRSDVRGNRIATLSEDRTVAGVSPDSETGVHRARADTRHQHNLVLGQLGKEIPAKTSVKPAFH